MTAETETIARILANGFNEHIRRHGPDGDHAGEAVEDGDGFDGLIVMRQGAQYAVRVERLPAESAEPSLGERVTAVLVGAGFIDGEDAPGRAAFHVTDGVGVSLGPFWRNASKDVRAEQLARIAYLLETKGGIDVPGRDRYLYVHEPKQAGQEAATAAGEGSQ
jgi:hypothetical protein